MGLPSGPHGVKTFVKAKCEEAWKEYASLKDARVAQECSGEQTAVILDGNVLVRQVPQKANTFDEYTSIFNKFVDSALHAGNVVVVVFDEPALMTKAKAAEQAKRDAQAKRGAITMSADLAESFAPTTDNYDYDVAISADPHEILRSRAARPRMFDAICKHTMTTLMINSKAHAGKTLIFDGIDPRGASRPADEMRDPCMYSNDDRAATLLTRPASAPIVAEGDLKITDVESEIQHLRDTCKYFTSIELFLVCTIDTDSIGIELMHQSAKNEARAVSQHLEGERTPPRTLLCFRETPSRKRKEPGNNDNPFAEFSFDVTAGATQRYAPATFACFDVAELHNSIVKHLGAPSGFHRHATALLASAWCLCGSDFVHLKGMRSDVAFESVADLCKSADATKLLKDVEATWELRRDTDPVTVAAVRNAMLGPIGHVVQSTRDRLKGMPRMGKSVASINQVIEDREALRATLLKAAWCAVYWSGLQIPNSELADWGFLLDSPFACAASLAGSPVPPP